MTNLPLPVLKLVTGVLLLLFGRKLFWLFVAAIGFVVGLEATTYLMPHAPAWVSATAAIVLGIVGAFVAIFLQKIAIAVAGFLAGGHLALILMTAVHAPHQYLWIDFVVGGIVGALLLLGLFGWALILLTAVEGARLITHELALPAHAALVAFIVLIVCGLAVQTSMKRKST